MAGATRSLFLSHARLSTAYFVAALLLSVEILAFGAIPAHAAEFGTSPWLKGYRDVFTGMLPPVPGIYVRTDAYHYDGSVDATVFDGRVAVGVDNDMTIVIPSVTVVTNEKIFGATYAFGIAPTLMDADVNLGVHAGRFGLDRGDRTFDLGDTVFTPVILGWNSGKLSWNVALAGFAPTGEYDRHQLANTSLNHWAVLPQFGVTYFDPATGWDVSGAAIYEVSWANPETDYETGNILDVEGAITKHFGAWAFGGAYYAMMQVSGDSGSGAKLGSFESRDYGAGPIISYTWGIGTANPVTLLAKYYHEFEAQNTFQGDTVDAALSFKF